MPIHSEVLPRRGGGGGGGCPTVPNGGRPPTADFGDAVGAAGTWRGGGASMVEDNVGNGLVDVSAVGALAPATWSVASPHLGQNAAPGFTSCPLTQRPDIGAPHSPQKCTAAASSTTNRWPFAQLTSATPPSSQHRCRAPTQSAKRSQSIRLRSAARSGPDGSLVGTQQACGPRTVSYSSKWLSTRRISQPPRRPPLRSAYSGDGALCCLWNTLDRRCTLLQRLRAAGAR